jgi:transcriptional regulator with XRE-family HTH domain
MVEKKKTAIRPKKSSPAPTENIEPKAPPPKTADGIAIRIRIGRERKGLSLADLHRRSEISKTALHDYESGRTKPGAREIRILCEILEVTPNWVIFGTENPLEPRAGLRALIKSKDSPAWMMMSMFLMPIIAAVLDEDQLEALLVLIASMVEARDKDAYAQVSALAEVFAEQFGTGSPAELAEMSKRAADPVFMANLQEMVKARVKR